MENKKLKQTNQYISKHLTYVYQQQTKDVNGKVVAYSQQNDDVLILSNGYYFLYHLTWISQSKKDNIRPFVGQE